MHLYALPRSYEYLFSRYNSFVGILGFGVVSNSHAYIDTEAQTQTSALRYTHAHTHTRTRTRTRTRTHTHTHTHTHKPTHANRLVSRSNFKKQMHVRSNSP